MARVLLTGARGFVGGAVLRRLLADGHEVVALSATRAAADDGAEWRHLDLLGATAQEVAELVRETGVSHCLHAAWYTNHADYLVAAVNRDWLDSSLRLAEGFHAGGGKRFVGLGTCLEYDQAASGGRFSETRTPLRPETLYARCKTELFERLNGRGGAADFAWARLFFIYGPGDRAGRLIPYILAALAKGDRIGPRFGGLRRDYIHVDDLAGQLVRIAMSGVKGAINCGTGGAERLGDIFRTAGELAGRPELVDDNDLVDEAQSLVIEADMGLHGREVGEPGTRPIRQGLAEMMGGQP